MRIGRTSVSRRVSRAWSEDLQGAGLGLEWGSVRHGTDRLSAAVNNLSETKDFISRDQTLMVHDRLERERNRARQANDNGDAASSHSHFKEAVMIKGHELQMRLPKSLAFFRQLFVAVPLQNPQKHFLSLPDFLSKHPRLTNLRFNTTHFAIFTCVQIQPAFRTLNGDS